MGKPDTRRLDRAIAQASRKLAAVQNRELWPLDGRERRAVLAGLAGGSYKVVRGESPARADRKLETAWASAEIRLVAEIAALTTERQRVVNEAARAKAAKKSSGWW
ncbi:hypothetical protein AS594_17995 [Streptomyces agglomeratus]|uniref:Uncharacterized protein n=1 Tax=Streptomyces agglomeratus TaxID=285458 RepID=A0A1E5P967_9ACTN|nr:hypothetical protein [Streptomyces agglomeratus]OEJ26116.1 hypothetical protein AS594_17995 [Streptomyces agglomeratus]